jgi:hypothetical protein
MEVRIRTSVKITNEVLKRERRILDAQAKILSVLRKCPVSHRANVLIAAAALHGAFD